MKTVNTLKLKGLGEVATQIADNCFSEEQRQILEYRQGKTDITIADQIERFYGTRYLLYSLPHTIKIFSQIVHENEHLIDEIKEYKRKIEIIKDPSNYRQTTIVSSSGVSCNNHFSDSTGINRSASLSNSVDDNSNTSFARNMSAEPVELIRAADVIDDSSKLKTNTNYKEKITFTNENLEENTLLSTRKEQVADKAYNPVTDNRNYHNEAFTKTGDLSRVTSESFTDGRNINKNKSQGKGVGATSSKGSTITDVLADSTFKSMTIEIPRLRKKF